jgi:hypothetical protein
MTLKESIYENKVNSNDKCQSPNECQMPKPKKNNHESTKKQKNKTEGFLSTDRWSLIILPFTVYLFLSHWGFGFY